MKQRKEILITALSWLVLLLWMTLIFLSSSQPADISDANSTGIVIRLMEFAEHIRLIPAGTVQNSGAIGILDHYFRKTSHFLAYLVMALFALNAFRRNNLKGGRLYLLSFLLCAVYAGSDEYHQLFIQGRGAQFKDVLIDCSGSMTGLCINKLASWIGCLRQSRYNRDA